MDAHRNRGTGERALGDFISYALAFPTVLFGFPLVVVVAYWLLVLVGLAGVDAPDGGGGIDSDPSAAGSQGGHAGLGLGGVPLVVVLSLLTVVAWFVSLAGSVYAPSGLPWSALVLLGALLVAWIVTRGCCRVVRPFFRTERLVSHQDFVGRVCTVRTGRVDASFGQAEVVAADASTALVQVRCIEPDTELRAGSTALIFDYDADGAFFHVTPYDGALDPYQPPR